MPDIATTPGLSESEQARVAALADELGAEFGAPPLNDAALIGLGRRDVTHLIARDGTDIVGYAQLDPALGSAEIAGRAAVAERLLAAAPPPEPHLLVWAHGQPSPVGVAARAHGYTDVRTLWQLRRPLTALAPVPASEATIRPFEVGRDEDAWLELNAAAFAYHEEQGSWTLADLTAREAEPWFDPAGFLLAEREGRLLGFHWTKVHPGGLG